MRMAAKQGRIAMPTALLGLLMPGQFFDRFHFEADYNAIMAAHIVTNFKASCDEDTIKIRQLTSRSKTISRLQAQPVIALN